MLQTKQFILRVSLYCLQQQNKYSLWFGTANIHRVSSSPSGQILYSNSDPLNQLKDETVILNQTLSEDSSTNIGALNIQFADLIKGNKPSQEIN